MKARVPDSCDLLAVGIGFACALDARLLGRLYVGELLLAGLAIGTPLLWRRVAARGARPWIAAFLVLGGLYVLALVATDLYRETPSNDFLRGWVRAALFIGNTLGLLVLGFERPGRLACWIVGLAIGLLAVQAMRGTLDFANWKFGAAVPVTLLLLAATDGAAGRWTYLFLSALSVLHLMLDYRSVAGFCVLVALAVFVARRRQRTGGALVNVRSLGVGAVALAAFGAFYISNPAITVDGQDAIGRRLASNIERLAGLSVGFDMITRSPLVGYGSWPRNDEAFTEWATIQEELGSVPSAVALMELSAEAGEEGLVKTHSQFLQAWVEAGPIGALFFLAQWVALAWFTYRAMRDGTAPRLLPLLVFWSVWTMWAVLFSPFSGTVRLQNGISLALAAACVLGAGGRRPASRIATRI